jgi:hypothetical protein
MAAVAAVLFAITALGGIYLASLHFQGKALPMGIALLHGLLAASGLGLLVASALQVPYGMPVMIGWSIGLFVVAALGGVVLFSFHLRGKRLPSPLVLVHGLVAASGYVVFLLFLSGQAPR